MKGYFGVFRNMIGVNSNVKGPMSTPRIKTTLAQITKKKERNDYIHLSLL